MFTFIPKEIRVLKRMDSPLIFMTPKNLLKSGLQILFLCPYFTNLHCENGTSYGEESSS